jgi:ankyrin repeat protein
MLVQEVILPLSPIGSQQGVIHMPKPKISAKAAVEDIRTGMNDSAFMKKYGLTPVGLQSLLTKLVEAGYLSQSDLERWNSATEKTSFLPTLEASTLCHDTPGSESSGCAEAGREREAMDDQPKSQSQDHEQGGLGEGRFSLLLRVLCTVFPACMIGWLAGRTISQGGSNFLMWFLITGGVSLATFAAIAYLTKVRSGYFAVAGAVVFVVVMATVDWSTTNTVHERRAKPRVGSDFEKRESRMGKPKSKPQKSRRIHNSQALVDASILGKATRVEQLLSEGAHADSRDSSGQTGLIHAARQGHLEVVKILLDRGADIHAKDQHGYTSLMQASAMGNDEIVRLLLAKGGDVNAKDNVGSTALMQAGAQGKLTTARILLERGADVNHEDRHKMTALRWAHTSEMKALLTEHGAVEPNDAPENLNKRLIKASTGKSLDLVRNLLAKGADVNATDSKGKTP